MSLLMDALKQAEQNKSQGKTPEPASGGASIESTEVGGAIPTAHTPHEEAPPLAFETEESSPEVDPESAETDIPLLASPDTADTDNGEETLATELDFSEIEAAIAADNSPADPDPPAEVHSRPSTGAPIHAADPPQSTSEPSGVEPFSMASSAAVEMVEAERPLPSKKIGSGYQQHETPVKGEARFSNTTPDAAARLLAAGSRRQQRARRRQFILVALLIVVVMALVTGYYFWSRALHMQPLALPGELVQPAAVVTTPPQQTRAGQVDTEVPPGPEPAPVSQVPAQASPASEPPVVASKPTRAVPQAAPPRREKAPRQAMIKEKKTVRKPAGVVIQRHADSLSTYQLLTQAYAAYQENRILDARRLYETVLNKEPRSRDALLGLASVAVRQGREDEARSLYRRQLEADPKDGVARTALLGLLSTGDPVADESLIKQMLREHGELPYLRFALGNVYATQSRWDEAQQSYFRAYSAEPQNANYLFNLAVSLDHLHQDRMALQYYRWAVEQARGQAVKFDMEGARQRIRALSANVTEGAS